MSEIERNHYQRLFTNMRSLLSHENKEWPCEIVDISLHGCLLSFESTWENQNIEAIYTLTMHPSVITPIIMNLSMSHVIDNEVSFKCEHIDIEHSARLHQLAGSTPDMGKLLARDPLELARSA